MQVVKLDRAVTADDAVVWQDNCLYLLDQRVLPLKEQFIRLETATETAEAIASMVVRGAPAIGVTAAFGVVLAVREVRAAMPDAWKNALPALLDVLLQSRPTAINLYWAVRRMQHLLDALPDDHPDPELAMLAEAQKIHEEDRQSNRAMGGFGASLLGEAVSVITHCNAGALATGGYGTALGVIRSAFAGGKIRQVFADETRPWLQGSRLTAWELSRDRIPVTVLADGAAASLMKSGDIAWVIVGSDRIAANGDVANKIGTYHLAVAAKYHGVKVMVAAPTSTIDMAVASGEEIPIENRSPDEIMNCGTTRFGAAGVPAWNPVFDVTPAALVDAIVTEKGIVERPDADKIRQHMQGG